jgi:hypothetical protein
MGESNVVHHLLLPNFMEISWRWYTPVEWTFDSFFPALGDLWELFGPNEG